jgi:hypothetical protein
MLLDKTKKVEINSIKKGEILMLGRKKHQFFLKKHVKNDQASKN